MPAPRKCLGTKKLITKVQEAPMKPKLKALKEKYAARALELSRVALNAIKGIEALEEEMHAEAVQDVHPSYMEVDFKMTFEAMYDIHVTDYEDGSSPMLSTAVDILTELEKDAAAAYGGAATATAYGGAAPAEAADPVYGGTAPAEAADPAAGLPRAEAAAAC